VVEGTPFPPSLTVKPSAEPTSPAYFGHKAGNYMPSTGSVNATKTTSDLAARVLQVARAVGETVSNSALQRFDNSNINDGVGDGHDSYTMYCKCFDLCPWYPHLGLVTNCSQGELVVPTRGGRRAVTGSRSTTWYVSRLLMPHNT
jgi:hypothetical protein